MSLKRNQWVESFAEEDATEGDRRWWLRDRVIEREGGSYGNDGWVTVDCSHGESKWWRRTWNTARSLPSSHCWRSSRLSTVIKFSFLASTHLCCKEDKEEEAIWCKSLLWLLATRQLERASIKGDKGSLSLTGGWQDWDLWTRSENSLSSQRLLSQKLLKSTHHEEVFVYWHTMHARHTGASLWDFQHAGCYNPHSVFFATLCWTQEQWKSQHPDLENQKCSNFCRLVKVETDRKLHSKQLFPEPLLKVEFWAII